MMEPETEKQACILVVDDDQNLLRMVSRTLEMEGFQVLTAGDGGSALALLEQHKPDLVLLDIMMPGLDGFEVLRRIRQHSAVPVIMLTAVNEVSAVRDTIGLGADDYIRKPFSIVELLARIRCKLRRCRNTENRKYRNRDEREKPYGVSNDNLRGGKRNGEDG